ncbi:hypothetical protein RIF29_14360 [Crotalaria pallida]|uniref:Uncharacterized protein n=1 Tax=Crotalaria pallida TaxID=3830 RepID=A0AAN9II67_CROPI
MAKKRGRPPKTPPSTAKKDQGDNSKIEDVNTMNLANLEDADLDNLSPKKSQAILECIEALRQRLKGKAVADDVQELDPKIIDTNVNNDSEKSNPNEKAVETVKDQGFVKPDNVWANIDITKLRNAGEKLQFYQPELKDGVAERRATDEANAVILTATTDTTVTGKQVDDVQVQEEGEWTPGSLMFQICQKLKLLQRPLKELNRLFYANIDIREADIRDRLEKVQIELDQRSDDCILQQAEKDLMRQYSEIKKDALSFLKQKAKLLWLKEGDCNSKVFHNSIKTRQYQNRVLRLSNSDDMTESEGADKGGGDLRRNCAYNRSTT